MSLMFPDLFAGDSVTTRANWNRVVRACLGPDLVPMFRQLTYVPLQHCPGLIVLEDESGLTERAESHWRLVWVERMFRTRTLFWNECDPRTIRFQQDQILSGMEFCWFALAMLPNCGKSPALSGHFGGELFSQAYLRKVVHWLPEMVQLEHRLGFSCGDCFAPYCDSVKPFARYGLWSSLLGHASLAGFLHLSQNVRDDFIHTYNNSIINFFLDRGVIRSLPGGRFQLARDE